MRRLADLLARILTAHLTNLERTLMLDPDTLEFESELAAVVGDAGERRAFRQGLLDLTKCGVSPHEDFENIGRLVSQGVDQLVLGAHLDMRGIMTSVYDRRRGIEMLAERGIFERDAFYELVAFFTRCAVWLDTSGAVVEIDEPAQTATGVRVFPGWDHVRSQLDGLTVEELGRLLGGSATRVGAILLDQQGAA